MLRPCFQPGENIAMKVPPEEFDAVVAFYRDTLGFAVVSDDGDEGAIFDFGGKKLWIDRVPGLSQSELWLEIRTSDVEAAAEYLHARGVVRRDGIEPLPDGFSGFWVKNPSNIIHLVTES